MTPYIPDQVQGNDKEFRVKRILEEFENYDKLKGIGLTIRVKPEYSYRIFGSFKTEFGTLKPSKEFSIPGEFEGMMREVGCYIKDSYIHENGIESLISNNSITSSIDCAWACHNSTDCKEGWSYQTATKKCIFHKSVEIENLQPGSSLSPHEYTMGWATGLKSCSSQGIIISNTDKHTTKVVYLDIDGGWTDWKSVENEKLGCKVNMRSCTNPSPCGHGSNCYGKDIDSSHCPGKSRVDLTLFDSKHFFSSWELGRLGTLVRLLKILWAWKTSEKKRV